MSYKIRWYCGKCNEEIEEAEQERHIGCCDACWKERNKITTAMEDEINRLKE